MANGETRRKIKNKVKSHIPKDCLTEIRIFYRMVLETFKGIYQTGIVNIAIVVTMFIILVIFGGLFRGSLSAQAIADELGNTLQISAYLSPGADTSSVINTIKGLDNVKEVKFISKDRAWKNFKTDIDVPDIENPLPDTVHVKINKVENFDSVLSHVKKVKGVADTSYAASWVKTAQTVIHALHVAVPLFILAVIIMTTSIMGNTILLVIESRKDEIEIMRLMGVSNWYIKFPLILQGAIYGFVGSLLAVLFWQTGFLNDSFYWICEMFMVPKSTCSLFHAITIICVILLGTFCCGFGSYVCIKKHLQV